MPQLLPLLIIGLLFLTLLREWLEPEVAAWTAVLGCVVLGLLPMDKALAAFANPAPVTVACMFILSASLEKNGVVARVGYSLGRWTSQSEGSVLLVLCSVACCASAVLNNTAVVAVMIPVAVSLARKAKLSSSRLLLPLSYAAILGGTCTLIGTSTNLAVQGVLAERGEAPLRFFEFTPLGLIYAVIGILYLYFIGRHRLPDRGTPPEPTAVPSLPPLVQYLVLPESSLIGKTLVTTLIARFPQLDVLEVRRRGVPLQERLDGLGIRAGDRLLLAEKPSISPGARLQTGPVTLGADAASLGLQELENRAQSLEEAVVTAKSALEDQPISAASFRQRFGVRITRIVRDGEELTGDPRLERFQAGDQILLSGPTKGLERLLAQTELTPVKEAAQTPHPLTRAGIVSSCLFALFVIGAALHDFFPTTFRLPTEGMALLCAIGLILTRCLKQKEVYQAVNWNILFLITGMLSVGTMLDYTGTARWMAEVLAGGLGDAPGWLILSAVYFGCMVLTELISNNAVATMVTPVVITFAHQLGYDSRPFIIAVVFAASASFSTPVGYQTNTLVYGVGRYRFSDFLRTGIPLNLTLWVVASILIPLFWPLKP